MMLKKHKGLPPLLVGGVILYITVVFILRNEGVEFVSRYNL